MKKEYPFFCTWFSAGSFNSFITSYLLPGRKRWTAMGAPTGPLQRNQNIFSEFLTLFYYSLHPLARALGNGLPGTGLAAC